LLLLYQAELDGGALTLEQMSETLRLSLSNVVGQVGILERRGLVMEHRSSPNSRRRCAMRLAPLAVDAMASWFSLAFADE
jgi:DNA-binding MarR family transcriptional regulator